MKSYILFVLLILFVGLFAAQSVIVEATGTASMGDTKSKKETTDEAKANAVRNASENAGTYISSETKVRDYVMESDLVEAYSKADVKILDEKGEWFKDESLGDSYRLTITAEVTPKEFKEKPGKSGMADDPNAPLSVKLWTDKNKTDYKEGEKVSLFMKGNKPYFARVVYVQNDGTQVQILPNPYRKDNYFEGGTVYTLPSGKDQYDLTVSPPFGEEKIIVYASTSELGEVKAEDAGSFFVLSGSQEETGVKTRGIKITRKDKGSNKAAEFFESQVGIRTSK
ncbi:MAG: DUF4384 domain-containing protein [Candidatus Delongbacteria bacterium]|jgi:hypothetical protein|nr:DUF4384 domain-containing protein [Candidatus Delongbacteria bacterium]